MNLIDEIRTLKEEVADLKSKAANAEGVIGQLLKDSKVSDPTKLKEECMKLGKLIAELEKRKEVLWKAYTELYCEKLD